MQVQSNVVLICWRIVQSSPLLVGMMRSTAPILSNGGVGVISVTSNILDQIAQLTHFAHLLEIFTKAKAINDSLYEINKILFCESNPIPIKAAMYLADYWIL